MYLLSLSKRFTFHWVSHDNKRQWASASAINHSSTEWFFFSVLKKKNTTCYSVEYSNGWSENKSVWDWHCSVGMGKERFSDDSTLATYFCPLLTPACFSGASSPARPATPSVPCSSTTPPPPPPLPPSRPKLPPGKPGVGDVVCSLLPWLAQKLIVKVTNRSEKPSPL